MNDSASLELQHSLASHLCRQGLDEQLAKVFSKAVMENVLTWRVESWCSADDCNAIMGVAFGHQVSAKGNRRPGPVNESLANLVLRHYRRRPRPVYAQVEIAALLAADVPARHFFPIKPGSSKNGSSKHGGTESIIDEIANQVKEPQGAAPWLLIAHRHHAVRCAMIASEKGFGRVVTPELPDLYDRQCAQLWRRRHLPYLVSDVISRLTMYAAGRLYPALVRAERSPSHAEPDEDPTNNELLSTPLKASAKFASGPTKDQLNDDLPRLESDEDYAAIPCYKPEQPTPLTPSCTARAQQPVEQRRGDWTESALDQTGS